MEFFIRKNSTLPILEINLIKDGRLDFNYIGTNLIGSTIYFSMKDIDTQIYKVVNGVCTYSVENESVYYQLTKRNTSTVGRFEGEFNITTSQGLVILPLRDRMYINIIDSFVDPEFCCVGGNIPFIPIPTLTPTPTPTPTPSTPMFMMDLSIDVTIMSGSVIANIVVTNNTPVIRDTTISFVKNLIFEDDRVVPIDVVITIPEGQTSVTKQIIIDEDYDKLTEDTNIEIPVIDVRGIDNRQVVITENRQIHYVAPVKPGKVTPTPTPTNTPTLTPTSTPVPTPTNTPTNTPIVVLPTVYYGKYSRQNFDVSDLNLLSIVETNNIVNNYLMYVAVNGYCYMLIPNTMQQPTIFRNSNEGCSGFIIPFVKVDEVTIIDSYGQNIIYYVYRSFVSTNANVDVWVCD
jgi:hypothetical protein